MLNLKYLYKIQIQNMPIMKGCLCMLIFNNYLWYAKVPEGLYGVTGTRVRSQVNGDMVWNACLKEYTFQIWTVYFVMYRSNFTDKFTDRRTDKQTCRLKTICLWLFDEEAQKLSLAVNPNLEINIWFPSVQPNTNTFQLGSQ